MSSLAVRDIFKAILTSWCAIQTPVIGFYDSINKRIKPTEDLYVTLSFGVTGNDKLTFCNDEAEIGYCEVLIYGKAGAGDTSVLTVASDLAAAFIGYSDVVIDIEEIDAPNENTDGDALGGQYGVSVFMHYSYMK